MELGVKRGSDVRGCSLLVGCQTSLMSKRKEWTQQWRRDDAASFLYPMPCKPCRQAVQIAGYLTYQTNNQRGR
jgi:hypothetical protein